MARFPNLRARDLDLGSSHTAYSRASLIDLYLHAKFHWNRKNILWTDGRTSIRTFEAHFIRSTQKSPPKTYVSSLNFMINICWQYVLRSKLNLF